MYDIISSIIGHVFQTGSNAPGDQSYIYYICVILIPLSVVLIWDAIFTIFRSFTRFK